MTNARAAAPARRVDGGAPAVRAAATVHGPRGVVTAGTARMPYGSCPRRAETSGRDVAPARDVESERSGQATGRRRGERGATVIELAMLMPVVLAVVLLVVQVTLWFHGRQVADAAAREGARIARAGGSDGWQDAAESKARQIVQAIGPQLLKDAQATAWEQGDQRGVEITGSAVQVVPLLPQMTFTITSRFGGPIECFRPDDGSDGCE
ncbi:TadE/TadG family type IV pilus assembly protein [Microbispora sp. H11081]|uniref:TadE/TadG family type IV pilus assembly protein n=1 Tax=Microbispora sp. H11081 TaxID=2729107 RepID=UPI0028A024BD|nr:TadE/TadG family type IV pilus assembly protein [Microbispora sp. H11081]